MKKKYILIAISIATLGMSSCGPKEKEVSYETETVKRGSISNAVTATGTIEPVTKVEVGTQVSGIIDKIYVDYNSTVKKGQLIAELDKTNLMARLKSAQAQLMSAKSEYDYQKKNLERMKALFAKEFISKDEYETASLTFAKAEANYHAQQLSVNEAKTNLGYAYIYSPIDGVILSRVVEEGQTVAAAMTTPTLFTIAQDLTNMRVIANVDEADIGGVKVGQRVSFTVDAFSDDTFEGKVTQVRQQATTTSNVVTYEVVISAPNPDLKLKPGLTANVSILTMETPAVLNVSTKALRFQPDNDEIKKGDEIEDCKAPSKLWIKTGNKLKAIPVQTGASNGLFTEITSGIKEGQEIVTGVLNSDELAAPGKIPFMPGPPGAKKKGK